MNAGRILTLGEVSKRLGPRGAILTNDHIVLTPKPQGHFHARGYFAKDAVLSDAASALAIADEIAARFENDGIQAVVGPTVAGVSIAALVATQLYLRTGDDTINWGYAEETEDEIEVCRVIDDVLQDRREKLLLPNKAIRVIRRGLPAYFNGMRTLVVEDVFSSGGSAKVTMIAAEQVGAIIVGMAVICNRSGLTATDFGVPKLEVLFNIPMEMFPEETCQLCADLVPINMTVGHGAKFFARCPDSKVPRKE
ncbi:MAG: phosphoribosyltransferase family protein [Patescibacteria group bacterium]|jgi:orotate phosphoribosyltransferase